MYVLKLLFILPNIVKIFPEIKILLPKWAIKNENKIPCEGDYDCPFPAVCCNHPLFPLEKECCTGFGHRISNKKYSYNFIN
jgi:hypothetical protein